MYEEVEMFAFVLFGLGLILLIGSLVGLVIRIDSNGDLPRVNLTLIGIGLLIAAQIAHNWSR